MYHTHWYLSEWDNSIWLRVTAPINDYRLIESSSGLVDDNNGCISAELAKEGFVFESTVETGPQNDMATVLNQGSRRSPDHSTVANTVLVVHADKAGVDRPADNSEDKKLDFDRLEVIKRKREEDRIVADTQSFLNQQIRPSTNIRTKDDAKAPNRTQHLADQYLSIIRSAISSVYNVLYPQQLTVSQHPLILEFFKAKRKSSIHVPELYELETWNLQVLIDFITEWGIIEDLLVKTLQQKTLLS
ncbi:hypothetical protein RMATCC62417_14812 [Rhizopus microsporus]|nr:hypothetical protein RMATCC62417_14812 [Rhizopus microsporus]